MCYVQMKDTSNVCDITFAEKVRLFSQDYLKYCVYLSNDDAPSHVFSKKLYANLISTSQLLEDFLVFLPGAYSHYQAFESGVLLVEASAKPYHFLRVGRFRKV
jgi:hypothetical protein